MASQCTIKIHCSASEKSALEARAKARGLSLSFYLKRRGLSIGEPSNGHCSRVDIAIALDRAQQVLATIFEEVLRQDHALSLHRSRLLVAELARLQGGLEGAASLAIERTRG